MPDQSGAQASVEAMNDAQVTVDSICEAREVSTSVSSRHFLHAGPPIALSDIPGPMRGAITAGLLLEGEAADVTEANAIIEANDVSISPCHHNDAVGAMTGLITPRTPVVVIRSGGTRTFSQINEGIGGAVRYGSYDDGTLDRLRWLSEVLAPTLNEVVQNSEPLDLAELIAEGLRRGDDCHNRLVATSAALLAWATPGLLRSSRDREEVSQVARFMAENGHFALPFAIAAAKAIALQAAGIRSSPIVTAMAGNGRDFGIRVSGLGDRWFTSSSPIGRPVLIEGATMDDVTPTMGDSMIAETVGFGAFAMTAAPAIMSFVGGNMTLAHDVVDRMRQITAGTSARFLIPAEDFRGTPLGIDVHKVRQSGIQPVINNGLTHRVAGRGRVGAGITEIPLQPFIAASEALECEAAA